MLFMLLVQPLGLLVIVLPEITLGMMLGLIMLLGDAGSDTGIEETGSTDLLLVSLLLMGILFSIAYNVG